MQMFIFEDVLVDYTGGMAVIAAQDLQAAQALAFAKFGHRGTLEQFLEEQDGFNTPAGQYAVADGVVPGVLHHVFGGG